jgi:archaellum component FlaC
MLARIDNTLAGVKDTLQQIQENSDNIDKFEKNYADVMTELAHKLVGVFANPFKYVCIKA